MKGGMEHGSCSSNMPYHYCSNWFFDIRIKENEQ